MTKEQLMALGLSEDQATAVLKTFRESIDGNYIPKATFDAEREKNKTLTTQVSDRDTQLTELGAFKGTAEQLQARVAELETANTAAKQEYETKLLQTQKNSAVKFEIQNRVIDPDDVLPRLDFNKISFKDGKIESGLTEQLDALKTTKPHYFKAADAGKTPPTGFFMFGQTPPEGKDPPGGANEAVEFGKQLAQSNMQSQTIATKSADIYFK